MRVLIVSYRREDLLRRCVSHLKPHFAMSDLLIVDNHSDESPAIAQYCAAEGIELIQNPSNEGFAKAVNAGMRRILQDEQQHWVLLLNPDAEVLADPHDLIAAGTPNTACITTFNADLATPWDAELPIPNPWRIAWEDAGFGRIRLPIPLGSRYRAFADRHKGYLVGCFLLVSRAAWLRIGEFDERFWLYFEETDWCLRAYRSGMECTVVPTLGHRHQVGQTSSGNAAIERRTEEAFATSRTMFIEKHWGRSGLRAYAVSLSALTAVRRSVQVAKSLVRRQP